MRTQLRGLGSGHAQVLRAAALGSLAAVAPAVVHTAVASAAGLVLEAVPLMAGAAVLAAFGRRLLGPRAGRLAFWTRALGGCGCSGFPGALGLPAVVLTWIAFGPAVAALKLAAAVTVVVSHRHRHEGDGDAPVFDQLTAFAPYALGGGLVAALLGSVGPPLSRVPLASFAAGLLAGALMPCAPGAVAVAAALRFPAPWLAVGIVAVAGLRPLRAPVPPRPVSSAGRFHAFIAWGLLGIAGAAAAAGLAPGIVHPRFAWPIVVVCAGMAIRGSHPPARWWFAPAIVWAAILLGSPAPNYGFAGTTTNDGFAGQSVTFTGKVERQQGAYLLVRYAITCCRADAAPVALRLERDAPLPAGTWATLRGTYRWSRAGLVVRAESIRAVPAPRDPFIYR